MWVPFLYSIFQQVTWSSSFPPAWSRLFDTLASAAIVSHLLDSVIHVWWLHSLTHTVYMSNHSSYFKIVIVFSNKDHTHWNFPLEIQTDSLPLPKNRFACHEPARSAGQVSPWSDAINLSSSFPSFTYLHQGFTMLEITHFPKLPRQTYFW